jgi:hypothetical protein
MEKPDERSIMPGPYPPYPQFKPSYTVTLYYKVGDRATVRGIDYTGIVTGIFIGPNLGVSYRVDNGSGERYYPDEALQPEYPHPLPPYPYRHEGQDDSQADSKTEG